MRLRFVSAGRGRMTVSPVVLFHHHVAVNRVSTQARRVTVVAVTVCGFDRADSVTERQQDIQNE